jgi:hypothetical protein
MSPTKNRRLDCYQKGSIGRRRQSALAIYPEPGCDMPRRRGIDMRHQAKAGMIKERPGPYRRPGRPYPPQVVDMALEERLLAASERELLETRKARADAAALRAKARSAAKLARKARKAASQAAAERKDMVNSRPASQAAAAVGNSEQTGP